MKNIKNNAPSNGAQGTFYGPAHIEGLARSQLSLHQLRAPVSDFVGREQEIGQLVQALSKATMSGATVAIGGVRGMGSCGKSESLALSSHMLFERRPSSRCSLHPYLAPIGHRCWLMADCYSISRPTYSTAGRRTRRSHLSEYASKSPFSTSIARESGRPWGAPWITSHAITCQRRNSRNIRTILTLRSILKDLHPSISS